MATSGEVLAIVLPILVGVSLVALASLVLRRGGGHLHDRLFGVLFLFSGVKSVGDGLTAQYTTGDGSAGYIADRLHASAPLFPDALSWLHVTQACALAMLPLLFLFCASFPHPAGWMARRPWLGAVAFVPSLVTGAVLFGAPHSPWLGDLALGFNVVASLLTALALAYILRTRRRSPDHIERTQALYVAAGFLPSFAATWVITGAFLGLRLQAVDFGTTVEVVAFVLRFLSPLFEILSAGLVAFAILKYNILGVDPKFRVGVKSVVVGFVFVVVFLVTQGVENIVLQGQLFAFAGEYGSFLLSGVTSVVLFKPIEKVSGRISERLLPGPGGDLRAIDRAAEVYHAQCTYVLRDAQVSERELAFLRNLQAQLGLADQTARAIEEEVERLLKVDAPQTGDSGAGKDKDAAATPVEAVPAAREAPPADPPAGPGP